MEKRWVQGHYPEIQSAQQDWPYLPVRPPSPSLTTTFHDSHVLPNNERACKQAGCSWEKETTFGGAGCGLWTFLPEERKINSLTIFTANLIFLAERWGFHLSIISSNKAKFYKTIKLVSQQAKRQKEVLHTQSCIHTHTSLSNRKHFDITLHEGIQEHTETEQHHYSCISGTELGDAVCRIKYTTKHSHRYWMFLPLVSIHWQKELISWYIAWKQNQLSKNILYITGLGIITFFWSCWWSLLTNFVLQ